MTHTSTGAYPDRTPDGKDIVYVAVPGIEETDTWRSANRADREVSARMQALSHARELATYHRATADEVQPQTLTERTDQVIDLAIRLEAYLLRGVR